MYKLMVENDKGQWEEVKGVSSVEVKNEPIEITKDDDKWESFKYNPKTIYTFTVEERT
jgi:copper chaperone CopZ